MKSWIFLLCMSLSGFTASAQKVSEYDSVLAKKMGADERGMKMYVLVILKTGTNTTTDKAFIDSCFAGHFSNMKRMADMGKLIVAGPLEKNEKTYRGIFILDCKMEEVDGLLQSDPAIHSGILDTEKYGWYGSAALPIYLESVKKVTKKPF